MNLKEAWCKVKSWCENPPWPTKRSIQYVECYSGGDTDNNNPNVGNWGRNATVTKLPGNGRWRVDFATPHPDGIEYHVSFSAEEPAVTRDNPKITIEEGTKSSTGFVLMLTTDDNGTAADIYTDQAWSFGVTAPKTLAIF